MRLLAIVAALTLAVSAPVAGAPSPAGFEGVDTAPPRLSPTAAGSPAPALVPDPAAEADAGRGPGREGLVAKVLTVILGLTAAALAFRALRRTHSTRSRRR
jgi:hypothetical protein